MLAMRSLKRWLPHFDAKELLVKRLEVSAMIRKNLMARADNFHLILDDVAITHLSFGREFARAIEQKQVAQQEAERQTYVVMKADQERKAAIIRAEGDAEAVTAISEAIKRSGTGLIEVRQIDAAKDVARKMASNGRGNITYIPSTGGDGGSDKSGILLNVDTK